MRNQRRSQPNGQGASTLCTYSLLIVTSSLIAQTAAFVVPSNYAKVSTSINLSSKAVTPPRDEGKLTDAIDIEPTFEEHEFMDDAALIETLESFNPTNLHLDEHYITPKYEMEHEVEEGNPKLGIWAARALLLGVAVLWGTNFASVKYLETLCFHPPCHHPPSEAALARFGVAALVSLPLLIGQKKDIILAGMECGFWIALGYMTQAMALSTIPSGKCAFICSLTVVVVPFISAVFFGKKVKLVNMASAALAILGVGVLEGMFDIPAVLGIQPATANVSALTTALPEHAASAITASTPTIASAATAAATAETTDSLASAAATIGLGKGDLLALGQPFGFGISFMRIEHYVEKFEDVDNQILTIAAAQCVTVGLVAMLWVLYDFDFTIPNMSYMLEPHRIGAIAWTGIMTTVVAIYFEGMALQVATATEAALTFASEPVWASLFGAWLLKEKLNINSYVGGAIILTACLMSAIADLPSSSSSTEEEQDPESADSTSIKENAKDDKLIAP